MREAAIHPLLGSVALADAAAGHAPSGRIGVLHGADKASRVRAARLRARLVASGMESLEVTPLEARWRRETLRGSGVDLLVDAGGFGPAEARRIAAFAGVPLLALPAGSAEASGTSHPVIGLHAGRRLASVALGRVELRPPRNGSGLVSVSLDGVRFQVRDRERLRVSLVGRGGASQLAGAVLGVTAVIYRGVELTAEAVGGLGSLEADGRPVEPAEDAVTCRAMRERLRVLPVAR